MSLCSTCISTPFLDLPLLPEFEHIRVYESESFYVFQFSQAVSNSHVGVAHHTTFDELFTSAESCSICKLVAQSAKVVLLDLEEHDRQTTLQKADYGPGVKLPICFQGSLRICGRQGGQHGFIVLAPLTNESTRCLLIAAAGYCVEEHSPLAGEYYGRPVPIDPLERSTIDWILTSMRTCEMVHSHKPQQSELLPSRMLEVVRSTARLDMVKLVDFDTENGLYAALSHCWGSSKNLTATKANIQTLRAGIPVSDLARTFQDAIALVREFGLRYLWIDSLCILQDDEKDWEREAAKMSTVYLNAFVTIGASNAADDADGFLGPRPLREYASIPVTLGNVSCRVLAFEVKPKLLLDPMQYVLMDNEPLNSRAWALQERFLSLRTIHFGREQISFECRCHFITEDGYTHFEALDYVDLDAARFRSLPQKLRRERAWSYIIETYSKRNLTYPSDKLPALGGLARHFDYTFEETSQHPSQYVAGLWRENLIKGLIWVRLLTHKKIARPPTYRAPSWSWASVDGPMFSFCDVGGLQNLQELAAVEDVCIYSQGENPYGAVQGGYLKLKGLLFPVHFDDRPGRDIAVSVIVDDQRHLCEDFLFDFDPAFCHQDMMAPKFHFLCLLSWSEDDQPSLFRVPSPASSDSDHPSNLPSIPPSLSKLPLASPPPLRVQTSSYVRGLVLQSQTGDTRNGITGEVFSRLGCAIINGSIKQILTRHREENQRSITLV